jgi:hypothetical protein
LGFWKGLGHIWKIQKVRRASVQKDMGVDVIWMKYMGEIVKWQGLFKSRN